MTSWATLILDNLRMHHAKQVKAWLAEHADAIEVFNDILQQETAFQAALSVTGRVSELSILDYL